MVSFESYILKQQHKKVAALGDRLSKVDELINWHPFRKIVSGITTTRLQRTDDRTQTCFP